MFREGPSAAARSSVEVTVVGAFAQKGRLRCGGIRYPDQANFPQVAPLLW